MDFFKSLLSLILLTVVAACNSGEPPSASTPMKVTDAISGPKDLPNHKKYRDFIKTPLRDLKVTEEMTLVDNFSDILRYHRVHTKGKAREMKEQLILFFKNRF